jgi:hypothetical protein
VVTTVVVVDVSAPTADDESGTTRHRGTKATTARRVRFIEATWIAPNGPDEFLAFRTASAVALPTL